MTYVIISAIGMLLIINIGIIIKLMRLKDCILDIKGKEKDLRFKFDLYRIRLEAIEDFIKQRQDDVSFYKGMLIK